MEKNDTNPSTPSPRYATITNPVIEAVLGGHFRFALRDVAVKRLRSIAQQFDSVYDDSDPQSPKLTLWVRGLGINDEAEKAGFQGNFVMLSLAVLERNIITIRADKIDKPLAEHPLKKRPRQKHPNWGHPVLRNVRRETPYPSQQAAREDLARLHFEYPEVTIPSHEDKLLSIVYEKKPGEKPIKKYVFYIREVLDENDQPTGQWRIKCKENIQGKSLSGGSKKASMDLAAVAASVMGPSK